MAETSPTTTKDLAASREQVAKDQLAKDKEVRARIVEEATEATENVQPTPTQEENDLARMGVDVPLKEPDGSGPEMQLLRTKQRPDEKQSAPKSPSSSSDKIEPEKPGTQAYATRQTTAKPPAS